MQVNTAEGVFYALNSDEGFVAQPNEPVPVPVPVPESRDEAGITGPAHPAAGTAAPQNQH
jgi:hypothetical protein